jgi:hypothetical protein
MQRTHDLAFEIEIKVNGEVAMAARIVPDRRWRRLATRGRRSQQSSSLRLIETD